MKSVRYLKVVLTVIAVCLVWICLRDLVIVEPAHAFGESSGRYQIAAGQSLAFRLDTETGQICSYSALKDGLGDCAP